jgi:hypothetical protein
MNMILPLDHSFRESDMLAAATHAVGIEHIDHENEDRKMQDTRSMVWDNQYESQTSARESWDRSVGGTFTYSW